MDTSAYSNTCYLCNDLKSLSLGRKQENLKHRQKEESLLEKEISSFKCPIQQWFMGGTEGKKGESQMNIFCSFFVRTANLFCIRERFLCQG